MTPDLFHPWQLDRARALAPPWDLAPPGALTHQVNTPAPRPGWVAPDPVRDVGELDSPL